MDGDGGILEELFLYLEEAGEGIIFVEVNEPSRQEFIVSEIKKKVPSKDLTLIDLKGLSKDTTHLDEAKLRTKKEPHSKISLILNLHTLAEGSNEKELALVRDLNFSREPYTKLKKLIVFFFPSYFVDLIVRHARDFFDFVPMNFKFPPLKSAPFEIIDSSRNMADEKFMKNRAAFLESSLNSAEFTNREQAHRLFDLAEVYRKLYSYENALARYEEALKLSREVDEAKLEATIINNIGLIYIARSDYDRALLYLKEALKISRENGDKHFEWTALNNISQVYDARGNYDSALECLEQSLIISREIGDKFCEGVTLNNVGQIYNARGDDDRALAYLEKSLMIRLEIGDKNGELATLNNMGQIYIAHSDNDRALVYLKEALNISREIGHKRGEGSILNNIGNSYYGRGDYGKALEYLEKSLMLRQEIGDKKGEGATLNNISQIYDARGNYNSALEYLEQSLKISREIGANSDQIPTLHNMAIIEADKGNKTKFFEYEYAAYELAMKTGNAMGLYKVGQTLGEALCMEGKKDEGQRMLERSIEIGKKGNFSGVEQIKEILKD